MKNVAIVYVDILGSLGSEIMLYNVEKWTNTGRIGWECSEDKAAVPSSWLLPLGHVLP
jgi:hypothetical protein